MTTPSNPSRRLAPGGAGRPAAKSRFSGARSSFHNPRTGAFKPKSGSSFGRPPNKVRGPIHKAPFHKGSEGPSKSFGKPAFASGPRPFTPGSRPPTRSFGSSPRPFSPGGRPPMRSFEGDRPAPRPYEGSKPSLPPRQYSKPAFSSGARSFGDKPRPTFGASPRPYSRGGARPFGGDRPAPRPYEGSKPPTAPRSFGGDRGSARPSFGPKKSFGPRRDKEPDYGIPRAFNKFPSDYGQEATPRHTAGTFASRPSTYRRDEEAAGAPKRAFIPRTGATGDAGTSATPEVKTSWGEVATWYDETVSDENSYQRSLILPHLLRLIDPKRGTHLLDVGCGQGLFANTFAEKGAQVTGVDISPELIALSSKLAHANADFQVAPSDVMPFLKTGTIDGAYAVLSLQNIERLDTTLKEIARVLKSGASFSIVLNHPAFRVPKQTSWGFDAEANIQYRRIDRYLSDLRIPITMNPGAKQSAVTVSFHRPLQSYFKLLNKHGFAVDRLEEWTANKESQPGPRAQAENTSRKEIPLFLYMRAKHIGE